MPNKRKRPAAKPVTFQLKSRRVARQRTTKFHTLMHSHEAAQRAGDTATARALSETIESERKAYQHASIVSTAHHKTSRWVFQELERLQRRPRKGGAALKLLEVGAINTQLVDGAPWLDVDAIDIASRHPRIRAIDFFELDVVTPPKYDVLVLSMVINCVPAAEARGTMLRLCRAHLRTGGLFFVMLPLLCLCNSRHMTESLFVALLHRLGFVLRGRKQTPKVAFFCAEAVDGDIESQANSSPAGGVQGGPNASASANTSASAGTNTNTNTNISASARASSDAAASANAKASDKDHDWSQLRVLRRGKKRNNFGIKLIAQQS